MTSDATVIESVLKRDRAVVIAALLGITLLAWLYLVDMARDMSAMDMPMGEAMGEAMEMTQIAQWTPGYFLMMFLMWAIMMVGMMVPSAAPTTMVYAAVARKAGRQGSVVAPTVVFVSGYVALWTLFSVFATVAQWALDQAALLSPMMVTTSPLLGAGLLVAAGVYQVTPTKLACLEH